MSHNKAEARTPWKALWRSPFRAVLLGVLGAIAAGLFAVACGAILCLVHGLPWAYATWWGLRGAFAGLVAGMVVGALSGIYHVDEAPAESEGASPRPAPLGNRTFLSTRPAVPVPLERNGVRYRS